MGEMLDWLFNKQNTPEARFRTHVAQFQDEDRRRATGDALPPLTTGEITSRISFVQSNLLKFSPVENLNQHVETYFRNEVDFLESQLRLLEYGPELKNYFRFKEREIFTAFERGYEREKMIDFYPRLNPEQRCQLLQDFSDKIFDTFRKDHEGLQKPEVVLGQDPHSYGWVYVDLEQIHKGEFRPIHIDEKKKTLFHDLHTIAHEATHHVMQQFISLHVRGEEKFPDAITHDLEKRYQQIRRNALPLPEIDRAYHTDAEEYMAFHMGYVFQFLYSAHHNIGNADDAFRLIDNMEADIEALARGRKLPGIDDNINTANEYEPK